MFGKFLEGKSGSAEATEAVGKVGDPQADAPVWLAALPRVRRRCAGAGKTKGCRVFSITASWARPGCSGAAAAVLVGPPAPQYWAAHGSAALSYASVAWRYCALFLPLGPGDRSPNTISYYP
jgi:hypothetical protein